MSKEITTILREPFHKRAKAFEAEVSRALYKEAAKWESASFTVRNELDTSLEFAKFLNSGTLSGLKSIADSSFAKRIANLKELKVEFEITAGSDSQLMQFSERAFSVVSQLVVKYTGQIVQDRPRAVDHRKYGGAAFYEFSVYFKD